jgi:hypothetical protein
MQPGHYLRFLASTPQNIEKTLSGEYVVIARVLNNVESVLM